jgi:predicted Zn-dependent protease
MVRVGRTLWFLLPTQRLADAANEINRAVTFDPISPVVRVTQLWVLYSMRKPETVDSARALVQMFPSLPICRFAAGLALLRFDLVEEAATAIEGGLQIAPADAFLLGVLALTRIRQGRTADVEQIRASLEERARGQYIPFLPRAFAAEACGDLDSAYSLLSRAIEEREPLALINLADRRTDLVSDLRYQSLLRRMNLA